MATNIDIEKKEDAAARLSITNDTPDKKNTTDDAQTLPVVPSGVSGKEAFELGDEIFYNGRLKLLSVSGKRLWIKTSTG